MLEQVATAQICVAPPTLTSISVNAPTRRYVVGLLFIVAQCFVWITASVLTQYMFEETGVDSPFLMTYVGVSLLIVLFPIQWLSERWEVIRKTDSACASDSLSSSVRSDDDDGIIAARSAAAADNNNDNHHHHHHHDDGDDVNHDNNNISEAGSYENEANNDKTILEIAVKNAQTKKPWNHRKHALAALHIAPAMFLSDYAYNKGLKHTTVASSTVLVSTSCIVVLFFSVLLRLEHFRYGKVLGVVLAVLGTAMTTCHDAAKQDDLDIAAEAATDPYSYYSYSDDTEVSSVMTDNVSEEVDLVNGDMYSLLAAVGYAVYSVQALVLCPKDEELYSMTLLLGYVGVVCSVPLLPMALYKFYELESLSWRSMGILIIKGLLDFVVTDYLLFRAVMLTNATIANVGLGLTIPLAFAADMIFRGIAVIPLQAAGALTILTGFILVNCLNDSSVDPPTEEKSTTSPKQPWDDEPEILPYFEMSTQTHNGRKATQGDLVIV